MIRDLMAQHGVSIPLPPAQAFDWAAVLKPGIVAVLLFVLIIYLRRTRTGRASKETS
jgi:hypothetical protein